MNNVIVRTLCAIAGLLCAGIGIIGMFVPVLPTTLFFFLAGFFLPFIQAPQHVAARNTLWKDLREP